MKKFYVLLFTIPVLFFILLYLSVWWFIGGIAVLMIFIAYRFYAERLLASESRGEVLGIELEELHTRMETAVVKEQKANKEADQVKQLKQQLLSVISHEIRTPMNGVLGMSLLLSDTHLTKEQQEYVDTIRSCSESLLTTINNLLVNDILDFSRLQQDGNRLEYKDFDLRDSVEEVLELLAVKAGKAGLDLIYEIDENVPEQIIGDSKRIRQVLMNLIENAVKFTRRGEVFVGVQYMPSATAGYPPELKFEVRDTGIGIAKDQLRQLFKGIPVKETSKKADTEVRGLGLIICKKLVEMMGGRIDVTSQEGLGSTFTFSLPLTTSPRSTRDHAQHNNMNMLGGKHVLIVDDNATQLTILVKQMKYWKMVPIGVSSGQQALETLSKNSAFDLIITDVNMPGMDGIHLTTFIREQYPAIPVIGMNTVQEGSNNKESGMFSAVLAKPLRQYILRNKVLALLSQAGAITQNNENFLPDDFSNRYPLRILIAEDNLINQKIAVKILGKLGYEPSLANNGKEALEMISQEHYDVILMDVQMPEMNGLEATRMIRTCLETQPVIIALTANAMQGDRDDCMQAGMDDYMSKPIELKELLSQLEKWALLIREKRRA